MIYSEQWLKDRQSVLKLYRSRQAVWTKAMKELAERSDVEFAEGAVMIAKMIARWADKAASVQAEIKTLPALEQSVAVPVDRCLGYDGDLMELVTKDGSRVMVDQQYPDFRGDPVTVSGGAAPHKEAATGYVYTEGGMRMYASVIGAYWRRCIPLSFEG